MGVFAFLFVLQRETKGNKEKQRKTKGKNKTKTEKQKTHKRKTKEKKGNKRKKQEKTHNQQRKSNAPRARAPRAPRGAHSAVRARVSQKNETFMKHFLVGGPAGPQKK